MCPFCYLGDTILVQALEKFEHAEKIEVRYHSFLLMPELPVETAIDLDELLATKRGFSKEQAAAMNAQIAERGREYGLDYRMDRAAATNTRRAHELSHFAGQQGRQHEMIQRLFRAYFTDGLNVGDLEVLADLAAGLGLDRNAVLAALQSGDFADAVEADIQRARQLGIRGVPFFVFNDKYAISGAQPVEAFLQVLEKAWGETTGTPTAA